MSDGNLNRAVAHAAIAMRHDDLKRVYFASAVCFDRIYIHGGCQEAAGKLPRPLNDMLMYDYGKFFFVITWCSVTRNFLKCDATFRNEFPGSRTMWNCNANFMQT